MAEIATAYVTLLPSMKGFGSKLGAGTSAAADQAGKKSGGRFSAAFSKVAALGIGAAVGGLIKNSVGLEAEFSKTMNVLQATTDASGKSMGRLTDLAMKMGAETVFSANDASKAMLELARGGMTAATIQGGALKGTLTLAAAGELEMGEAANIAVKAMGAFNLKGKEMDAVAAALAGGANASSASVRDMSIALAQGGLAANSVGFSIQETTGILAAFSNAGLEGSDAGTSLKTMLDRLQPSTDKQSAALKQLGIITKDGANQFLKANGEYKSAAQIAELLRQGTEKLTDAERKRLITQAFGSDAQRAATILAEEGARGIEKMVKATSDQDAAQKMAAANMKGTAGAIERLKGAFETMALTIGIALAPKIQAVANTLSESVLPAISAFITGMANGTGAGGQFAAAIMSVISALTTVGGFLLDHKTAVLALAAATGVLVAVTKVHAAVMAVQAAGGLLKYLATIKVVTVATKAWAAVQWAMNAALLANPVGLVIVAIAALVAGVIIAYKKSETFRNIVQQTWATLKTFASVLSGVVAGAIRVVIAFVGDLIGRMVAAGKAIRERVQDAAEFAQGIKQKFGEAVNFVQSIPGKITAALGNLGSLLYNAGISVLAGFVEGIRSKIDDLQGVLSGITDKIPDWKGPADKDAVLLRPAGQMIMKGLVDGIEDGTAALREKLQGITDEIKSRIDSIKSDMASLAGSVASAFTGNLFEATDTQGFLGNLLDTKGQLKELKRAFKRLVKWGLSPQFLSQLFASGNGALILDMAASGNRGFALEAAQTFGQVNSLANSLGGQVARNEYGKKLDRANDHLADIRRDIKNLPKRIGNEINGAAAAGQRGRVA